MRGCKKGIFVSSDTYANVLLNLIVRKHGKLPEDYRIIGFDNSPISSEAILPISTIGQQIDKLAYEAVKLLVEQMNERKKRKPVLLKEPIHRTVTPDLNTPGDYRGNNRVKSPIKFVQIYQKCQKRPGHFRK